MKRRIWTAGVSSALIAFAIAVALVRTPDTDREAMLEKYGAGVAQFAEGHACGVIHYRDEGNRAGPALILIHGSNSSLQTWEGVVEGLAPRYRLISLDLWGHGLTGPCQTGDYSARSMIAAVTIVLDAAGVENAVWVGNSMGGWVAWRGAIDAPERVSGLVLIDAAGAQVEAEAQPYLGARLAQSPIGQAIVPYFMPRWIVKSSLEQNYAHPEALTDVQVDRYWELLRLPGNRGAVAERANIDREAERWNEVSAITAPTLILWGEGDRVIPVAHAHAFAGAITSSRLLTYPDVGHLPMEESPERVSNDIATWLAGQFNEGAP